MENDSLSTPALTLCASTPAKTENRRWMRAAIAALSILFILLAQVAPQNRSFGVLANVDFDAEYAFELDDKSEGGETPFPADPLASEATEISESDAIRLAVLDRASSRLHHHYSLSEPRGPPVGA